MGNAVNSALNPVGPTLAERWDGIKWSIQPIPNPSSPGGGILNWVACPSASACTAVGASVDASANANPLATLAERWNGTRWSIQPTPNPADVQGVRLEGVACTSPSACTAVGGSFANASLAERWNGTKWMIQASPNPVGQIFDLILFAVACPRPLHCMAVGKYASFAPHFTATLAPQLTVAEQWNGSSGNARQAATVSEIPTALGPGVLAGAASHHERLGSSDVLCGQVRGWARSVNNASLEDLPSPVPRNVRWDELRTPGSAEPANLRAQTVAIEASTRRADSAGRLWTVLPGPASVVLRWCGRRVGAWVPA